jgi:hypothetical protein
MSGTLWLNGDVTWMPASWIFDNVLQRVAGELRSVDADLAEELLFAQTEVRYGYADLRRLDAARFPGLVGAAEQAYELLLLAGPETFHTPTAYEDFMRAFSDLKAMLRSDARAGGNRGMFGQAIFGAGTTWTAEWWVFDLLIEQFAAYTRLRDENLWAVLIRARTAGGVGSLDVRALDADSLRLLLQTVELVYTINTHAPASEGPAYYARVVPPLEAFLVKLQDALRDEDPAALSVTEDVNPSSLESRAAPRTHAGTDPLTGRSRPNEAGVARRLDRWLARRTGEPEQSAESNGRGR